MRRRMLAAPAVFATLLLAGCRTSTVPGSAYTPVNTPGLSSSGTASPAAASAMLTVRKTPLGYVLANSEGFTIYWFARDHRGSSRSACTGSCLQAWFPVTGRPVAGKGVTLDAVLGTITRSGGLVQATYNGYPLYTFSADSAPGQTSGNGSAGVWHVIPEKAPASSAPGGSW
jgi:predicted lipoprotein with Yx(FWY)xxD motif